MKQNQQWDDEFEQRLTQFLKDHLVELLTREGLSRPAVVYEIELRERLVRVEEAIKHLGELLQKTLDFMDVRFNAMDKRFEDLRSDMNKRFEAVDRRFASMQWLIGGGFTFLTVVIVVLKFLVGP